MVGVLVAVGQGRFEPHHVKKLLEAGELAAYPQNTIAPAAGLFLKSVEYGEDGVADCPSPSADPREPHPSSETSVSGLERGQQK